MKKILLFDSGQAFTLNSLSHQPIGGSESSILLLAKGLTQLGNSVVLLNNSNIGVEISGRLQIDHISNFDAYANVCDIILFNRIPASTFRNYVGHKKMYIWCHDAYDQNNCKWMINADPTKLFEKVFFVSEWQRGTCHRYLNFNISASEILPNCLDPHMDFSPSLEKSMNRLIFTSVPYKGIDVLKDIFDSLCIKTKRDDLEFYIYSSLGLYNQKESDSQYEKVFHSLINTSGIHVKESVPMLEINKQYILSNLLIHPGLYHETFGRVFIDGMMCGCLPVTVNNGASKEVIKNNGYILDQPNVFHEGTFNKFVDLIIHALNDPHLETKRKSAKAYSLTYDYVRVAKKFLDLIEI